MHGCCGGGLRLGQLDFAQPFCSSRSVAGGKSEGRIEARQQQALN